MSSIRLTMAQALIKYLNQQFISVDGVESPFFAGVMGIFGHGNVTGIGEALERDPGSLNFIQGKNEQGMVHAAVAYAKQQNRYKAFACTTSIGPGALNMITAAATATVNRIPVLLLPGDNFASRKPDPVLQQLEVAGDYGISTTDAFKPVSKYWDRIVRPEQLMTALNQAMRVLVDPAETGAVTLALPQDVQAEAYDYPTSFFKKRVHVIDRQLPSLSAIDRAAKLVSSKKHPLLIVGGGVLYANAMDELREFAERFQIPVAETQAGKSSLAWNHPLNVGAIGVTGSLAANRIAKQADLIIGVGTRYSDFTTSSKWGFQHENVQFVNININKLDAGKMSGVSIVADAKTGLQALLDALEKVNYVSQYEPMFIQEQKRIWDEEVNRLYHMELKEGFSQTRALGVVQECLHSTDVIVCAAGSLPGDLHRLWRALEPKTYHMEYGFSCMGYEVSGAFGTALAEPHRDVYALVGDGSYLMLHSELITSIQENRKFTILLFNNHGFQCIHNLQRGHGSDGFGNEFRYRDTQTRQLSGAYMPIDFAAHARSLGAQAYKATNAAELRAAIESARGESVTTLIEIAVVPGSNTGNYESWWHVGVPEVSVSSKVTEAYETMNSNLHKTQNFD